MTTKRIIGKILVTDRFYQEFGCLVSCISCQYDKQMPVGLPFSQALIMEAQVIDEIQVIYIGDFKRRYWSEFLAICSHISSSTNTPLTIGGSIDSYSISCQLFESGADKIVIGRSFCEGQDWVKKIISTFGRQSLVYSCDYKRIDGTIALRTTHGQWMACSSLDKHIKQVLDAEICGEIILNQTSLDGSKSYVEERIIPSTLHMATPVIIGCGLSDHMLISNLLTKGFDGVTLGTYLVKSDQSIQQIKARLLNSGHSIRMY